ncbi:MAG: hypothetical protein ACREBG_21005 [Pyrinomonadaceae bacterium]
MRSRQRTAFKAIAILLICAVAQLYMQIGLAQATQFFAKLTATKDGGPILVNGNSTPVGATIIPGSIIETRADQTATIDLDIGTLEVGQDTALRLDQTDGKVKITLTRGCAALKTKQGNEGEIATNMESVATTDKKKDDRIVVCYIGGNVTTGSTANSLLSGVTQTAAGAGGGGGIGTAVWVAIFGGIAAAIAVPVIGFRDDNRPVTSPSR